MISCKFSMAAIPHHGLSIHSRLLGGLKYVPLITVPKIVVVTVFEQILRTIAVELARVETIFGSFSFLTHCAARPVLRTRTVACSGGRTFAWLTGLHLTLFKLSKALQNRLLLSKCHRKTNFFALWPTSSTKHLQQLDNIKYYSSKEKGLTFQSHVSRAGKRNGTGVCTVLLWLTIAFSLSWYRFKQKCSPC